MARTYDDIYADIIEATDAKAQLETGADFWTTAADLTQRLRDLWHEIAMQAVADPAVPGWARFAAVVVRDRHDDQIREYRRLAGQRTDLEERLAGQGT